MLLYLYDPQKTRISDLLKQKRINFLENFQNFDNLNISEKNQIDPMQIIDGTIIEISQITPETKYLLAQHVLWRKNILCLYKKEKPPRRLLNFLYQKKVNKYIKIKPYSENNIKKILSSYVKSIYSDFLLSSS